MVKTVRTIGIIVWDFGAHGVARVVSYLLPIFKEMGLRTVLLTDAGEDADKFDASAADARVVIGNVNSPSRSGVLKKAIQDNGVDLIISHEYYELRRIAEDMHVAHGLGVKYVIHHHSVFTSGLISFERRRFFTRLITAYKNVDALITLSRVDACYFNTIGCPAFYIQNPVATTDCDYLGLEARGKMILWIGRLAEIKQLPEAIEIFSEVVAVEPEARLVVLGPTDGEFRDMYLKSKDLSVRKGCGGKVLFEGFKSNTTDYLGQARVMLVTSRFEGCPCVITEAGSCGCPTVSYDMPYVELIRDQKGVIAVNQGDRKAAVKEVLALLRDDEHWKECSAGALQSFKAKDDYDFTGRYKEFFDRLVNGDFGTELSSEEDYKLVVQTLTNHVCLVLDDVLSLNYWKRYAKQYCTIILRHPFAAAKAAVRIVLKRKR